MGKSKQNRNKLGAASVPPSENCLTQSEDPRICKSEGQEIGFSGHVIKPFTDTDACQFLIFALMSQFTLRASKRKKAKKHAFSGAEVSELLTQVFSKTDSIPEPLYAPSAWNITQIMMEKQFLIPDNYKNASLTEESVFHIKCESLLLEGDKSIHSDVLQRSVLLLLKLEGTEEKGERITPSSAPLTRYKSFVTSEQCSDEFTLERGTVDELVDYLTIETSSDISFRDSFVFTWPTFIDGVALAHLLVQRWRIVGSEEENNSETQKALFKSTKQRPIRIKIFSFIKIWVEHFPLLFRHDTPLWLALESLLEMVKEDMGDRCYRQLIDSIEHNITQKEEKENRLQFLLALPHNTAALSWDFILRNDPESIAQQITCIDHLMFSCISVEELLKGQWMKDNKLQKAPHICMLVDRFNKTAQWLVSIIVQCISVERRAHLLIRAINIAHACKELGNHYAGIAMLAGLNATPIRRLHRTWECLDQEDLLLIESLREFYSTDNNYKTYRESLQESASPCTPYIGLYLRDLVYLEDGNKDNIEDLINFKKRMNIGKLLLEIKRFQKRTYQIVPNYDWIPMLVSYPQISEAESYTISLRIEPRNPYLVIEELLQNEELLTARTFELRKKIEEIKQTFHMEQERNAELRKRCEQSPGWKRSFAVPTASTRRPKPFLLNRRSSSSICN